MKTLFVSGTDTEIGKTWVSCSVLASLRDQRQRVGAWKPVCSGAVEQDGELIWEDLQALTAAMGGDPGDEVLRDRICAQRFLAPMAPNIAARQEQRDVSDDVLCNGLQAWHSHADLVLGEGAGGLLSPTSDELLVADLIKKMQMPLLLVSANRLGTISQTLATVEAARSRELTLQAIVLNQCQPDVSDLMLSTNLSELRRLLPDIPILRVDYGQTLQEAGHGIKFADWFA